MKKIPRTVEELNGVEIDLQDNSFQIALTTDNGVVRQILASNELFAAILTDPTFKAVPIESYSIGETINLD